MRTLLIVDDQESVRHTLEFVFGCHGYRVLLAGSGHAAVEIMRAEFVDAALVDWHMPAMDGLKACAALVAVAREKGAVVPVWLMTAGHSGEGEKRAREAGAVAMLRKPFDAAQVITQLERQWAALGRGVAAERDQGPEAGR